VVRVLHPVAVHFKGSGFYSTDYGRGNRKQSRDGDKSDSSDSGPKKEPEKKAPAAEAT
jgi:predicted nucleic acid-binding Zn ribbon protein